MSAPTDVDPPRAAAAEAVRRALAEDLGPLGDITAALVPADRRARAVLRTRGAGVVAGRLCALEAFAQVDPAVAVAWRAPDGTAVAAGTAVAELEGPLRSLLTAERTALNFLSHLSGVATATRAVVDAVQATGRDVRVLDTRKTTPGLRALEKAAVRAGGGANHRAGLSDAVLVKDNHLAGTTVTDAVTRARAMWPGRTVEVECDRLDQALEAAAAGATVVMLDNMDPDEVARCVKEIRAAGETVLVEVSGGVTADSAAAFAAAGADLVSVGAITHSAPVLDIGLDIEER